jgi:hypothetical protein
MPGKILCNEFSLTSLTSPAGPPRSRSVRSVKSVKIHCTAFWGWRSGERQGAGCSGIYLGTPDEDANDVWMCERDPNFLQRGPR